MAQEYMAMSNKDRGLVALNTNVFSSIAIICIDEDKNLRLGEVGPFKSAVTAKVVDGKLVMEVNVNVKYHVNVQDTCASLQHKIHDNIKQMCEIDADVIDIKVVGFDFKEQ